MSQGYNKSVWCFQFCAALVHSVVSRCGWLDQKSKKNLLTVFCNKQTKWSRGFCFIFSLNTDELKSSTCFIYKMGEVLWQSLLVPRGARVHHVWLCTKGTAGEKAPYGCMATSDDCFLFFYFLKCHFSPLHCGQWSDVQLRFLTEVNN